MAKINKNINRNILKLYLIILAFLPLGGCNTNDKITTFTGSTMGTTYTVKIIGDSTVSQKNIEDRLNTIDKIFSTWNPNSELSLLNKKPTNQWLSVSDELFYVLKTAKKIHQQTQGYFDPGMGRLINLWGFGVKKVSQKPNHSEVNQALFNSSIQHLELKEQAKTLKKIKAIHLDLSAIAKGYGVDEIAKLLDTKNYLVEIGGEVRTQGKLNKKYWKIGIEQANNAVPIAIELNNQAIATSGNYRNYFIWKGRRYMHILNPKTGFPANSDLISVSVLHPQTILADAYATAIMAMGSVQAIAFAKQLKLSVILINIKHEIIKINL